MDFAAYKVKDIYEEKYASNPLHMYDPKNPEDWYTTTRDYLIGRNPVMQAMLKWAEGKGDAEIETSEIAKLPDLLSLMIDLEPTVAGSGLRSFLNLNLKNESSQWQRHTMI